MAQLIVQEADGRRQPFPDRLVFLLAAQGRKDDTRQEHHRQGGSEPEREQPLGQGDAPHGQKIGANLSTLSRVTMIDGTTISLGTGRPMSNRRAASAPSRAKVG